MDYPYPKRWLSPAELESEYGFSQSWQGKQRMLGNETSFPFTKVSKFIRYDRLLIDKWLEDHQVQGVL